METIKSKIVKLEDLPQLRNNHKDKKIVFCTGSFDILQSGHAVFFNQCKQFGDILIVGVGSDGVIKELKGNSRPINPENNRLFLVASIQDVDYSILNSRTLDSSKIDFKNIIQKLKPDVFVLNNDDSDIEEKRKLCESYNIDMKLVSRSVPSWLKPTSSTNIIDKIQFSNKAPLRIDFAGGWTDIPYIMQGNLGYVSNVTINPYIELKNRKFNFSGYPRGSGLSTSTAVKMLELITSKNYNIDSKSLSNISEDLFQLENKELNWAIGRQDQYSIVHGGFNCFECGQDYAKPIVNIDKRILEDFKKNLVLIHTGNSRNAQMVVEEVYKNYNNKRGKTALQKLSSYGMEFAHALCKKKFKHCATIMEKNFEAQKELAKFSSNSKLDSMYEHAKNNGAIGGKIIGAGGGGAFIFYCIDPKQVIKEIKKKFVDSFEIDFDFSYNNIKELNTI